MTVPILAFLSRIVLLALPETECTFFWSCSFFIALAYFQIIGLFVFVGLLIELIFDASSGMHEILERPWNLSYFLEILLLPAPLLYIEFLSGETTIEFRFRLMDEGGAGFGKLLLWGDVGGLLIEFLFINALEWDDYCASLSGTKTGGYF